jgi:GNAT superfamily N-acetyltransferase
MGNTQVESGPTEEKDVGQEKDSYTVIPFLGETIQGERLNFISSRWMRTARYGNDYFKLIDSDSYYKAYYKYVSSILKRPNTIVRFAVLTHDKDVILGFSVSEKNVLHYVLVLQDFRNKGIGRSLVPFEVTHITHVTKAILPLWNSKLPHALFDPFL